MTHTVAEKKNDNANRSQPCTMMRFLRQYGEDSSFRRDFKKTMQQMASIDTGEMETGKTKFYQSFESTRYRRFLNQEFQLEQSRGKR